MKTAEEKKRYRDRANRARRALLKEKEQYGNINDSAGKRYFAPVDYVLADAIDKALAFYSWYELEFPDDIGDPLFDLYWALALYRNEDKSQASYRLQKAMLANLYMLPFLFHEPIERIDMWHSSNLQEPDFLFQIEEFLDEPTQQERDWIKAEYSQPHVVALRQEFINTFHKLGNTKGFEKRSALLDNWKHFCNQHFQR